MGDLPPIATIVIGLLAAWALLVAILWLLRPRDVAVSELLAFVPDLVRLVRALLGDRTVELRVRFALAFLLAWLISPIDLIPEFIPVLGPLDDVVVAVVVLRYVRRRLGTASLRERWTGSDAGFALLQRLTGATP
jgi:uncharacterized membrane protein YkvA (DUF1232 family)